MRWLNHKWIKQFKRLTINLKKGNSINDRCELNVNFISKNDNRQNNTPSNEIQFNKLRQILRYCSFVCRLWVWFFSSTHTVPLLFRVCDEHRVNVNACQPYIRWIFFFWNIPFFLLVSKYVIRWSFIVTYRKFRLTGS